MTPLRLRAIDQVDLSVIAAHLQDAIAKISDMGFEAKKRRFAVLFNRFMWEDVEDDKGKGAKPDKNAPFRRVRTALHFDGVLRVQSTGLRLANSQALATLLTLKFEQVSDPAGAITLTFAGGGALKLEVECLDVWLNDVSAPWSTPHRPGHEIGTGKPIS